MQCDVDTEVVVIVQPTSSSNDPGWPSDYFEQIDRIEADDLVDQPSID